MSLIFFSTTVEILLEYTLWVSTYSKLTIRTTSICLVYFPYVRLKFQCKLAALISMGPIKNQGQRLRKNERVRNSVIIYLKVTHPANWVFFIKCRGAASGYWTRKGLKLDPDWGNFSNSTKSIFQFCLWVFLVNLIFQLWLKMHSYSNYLIQGFHLQEIYCINSKNEEII